MIRGTSQEEDRLRDGETKWVKRGGRKQRKMERE
jgi:hypothetical protein